MIKGPPVAILFTFLFIACNSRIDISHVTACNNSLVASNNFIAAQNTFCYDAMHDSFRSKYSYGGTRSWLAKADAVGKCSADVNRYINVLKVLLADVHSTLELEQFISNNASGLYDSIVSHNRRVLSVLETVIAEGDSLYDQHAVIQGRKTIEKSMLTRWGTGVDSLDMLPPKESAWVTRNFTVSDPLLAMLMLNKLQNDMLLTESEAISYCSAQLRFTYSCVSFLPMATLSSNYVEQGGFIELTTGIGSFESDASAKVYVYGKEVLADENGIATYGFKATGVPGKHIIPLVVKFTRPDGSVGEVHKNVEYTIAH